MQIGDRHWIETSECWIRMRTLTGMNVRSTAIPHWEIQEQCGSLTCIFRSGVMRGTRYANAAVHSPSHVADNVDRGERTLMRVGDVHCPPRPGVLPGALPGASQGWKVGRCGFNAAGAGFAGGGGGGRARPAHSAPRLGGDAMNPMPKMAKVRRTKGDRPGGNAFPALPPMQAKATDAPGMDRLGKWIANGRMVNGTHARIADLEWKDADNVSNIHGYGVSAVRAKAAKLAGLGPMPEIEETDPKVSQKPISTAKSSKAVRDINYSGSRAAEQVAAMLKPGR